MDDEMTVTPRIGTEVGDVTEADVPGCYHLITGKYPNKSPAGYGLVFDPFPSWRMVDGQLVPIPQDEGPQAYHDRPLD
ncbi:hypothetical protein MAHJHV55_27490 [Mycobacterium avium subsp. hominissuis]